MIPVMFVFAPFALMTRVSGVDDNFINKPRLVQDETIRQRQVSTAAAIEKSGTADTMVGQKSGPALAGPAAPATTALHLAQAPYVYSNYSTV